jgi:hypothetical protein
MHDDPKLEEMSGAVGMGLLASDIVLAIGKALRSEVLSDQDEQALRGGQQVLQALSSPVADLPLSDGLSQLGGSSTLDALQAVEGEVASGSVQERAAHFAEQLGAVIGGDPVDQHRDELAQIRMLFSRIGDVEVARASGLSRPTQDSPPWLTHETSLI